MPTTNPEAYAPEELHALIEEAMNTGDVEAFIALHEDGCTERIPPDGHQVTGTAALREALAPLFARDLHATIIVTGKLETGGIALTHALWALSVDGDEQRGRGAIVSRRQGDGSLEDPHR